MKPSVPKVYLAPTPQPHTLTQAGTQNQRLFEIYADVKILVHALLILEFIVLDIKKKGFDLHYMT